MTITRLTSQRKERRITAYDLEWLPGSMTLRLIGVYDERGYRSYTTVREFLASEMTSANAGRWFYAHAGGLADMQFIFHELVHRADYEVSAAFSGASAIIVKLKKGRRNWTFIDSYWTLRAGLAKIGEALDMPKGECAWDAPLAELAAYNEQDCRILYEALKQFERYLWSIGSQLQMTLASTSLQLFRRAFLKRDIITSRVINDRLRASYFGGRVEVIQEFAVDGYYYDINSSYPASMIKPLPADFIGTTRTIPEDKPPVSWIADVTVRVPRCMLPPLPYRRKLGMYFPTGSWRGWFCGEELCHALDNGVEIVKVHEVMNFDLFNDMAAFAETLYAKRQSVTNEFERFNLKILLNSLYGKWAERREKERLLINPKASFFGCKLNNAPDCPCSFCNSRMYSPGVFLEPFEKSVAHEHVALASAITARSRVALHAPMMHALHEGFEVHYCDTDGFSTDFPDLHTGEGLGAMKLEKTYRDAWFVLPKVYRIRSEDPDTGDLKTLVRMKGFPKRDGKPVNSDDFEVVCIGGDYDYLRMPRIRENLAHGSAKPREVPAKKRLAFSALPKRRPIDASGRTLPWDVNVLDRMTDSRDIEIEMQDDFAEEWQEILRETQGENGE